MKEVCIFGNGKSLEGFDFNKIDREKFDVIGTGMAFRHWQKINWFPNIYVNVDTVVCGNQEVIDFVKEEKCDFYIVSKVMLQKEEKLNRDKVFFLEDLLMFPQCSFRFVRNWCSGTAAVISSLDRYRKLHLFGFDCDYVEFIPECKKNKDGTLTIETTPDENPNYFFNDYQREGDTYNIPNGKTIHMKSWEELSYIIDFINKMYPEYQVEATNYSSKTSISKYFKTKMLGDFFMN